MLGSRARLVLVLILLNAWGCQWAALQLAAWGTMAARYAQTTTIAAAISEAVSGKKPCSLCKTVRRGAESQNETPAFSAERKADLFFSRSPRTLDPLKPLFTVLIEPQAEAPPHESPEILPPRSANA